MHDDVPLTTRGGDRRHSALRPRAVADEWDAPRIAAHGGVGWIGCGCRGRERQSGRNRGEDAFVARPRD